MATSSITKNFVIDTKEQAEIFAEAIEETYQESLSKRHKLVNVMDLYGNDEDMNKLKKRWCIK